MRTLISMSSRYILILSTLLIVPCWARYREPADPYASWTNSFNYEQNRESEPTLRSTNGCRCLPYYQCKLDGTFNSVGEGLLVPRVIDIGETSTPPSCQTNEQYCCPAANSRKPATDVTEPSLTERKTCGKRNPRGLILRGILSKKETEYGEFPWMAAILEQETNNLEKRVKFQCGGSFIHPQIVLTAAHCVNFYKDNPSVLKIRAGEWDSRMTSEILPHQDLLVKTIIVHENYHKGAKHNDLALLILSKAVDLSLDNVGIICLPEANENFDHSRCTASGWGKDDPAKPNLSSTLKRVELPIVPHNQCQSDLRKTRLGDIFDLHNSFICAGGEPGKDTCKGDGGGPLVCPMKGNPTKYVQAGIVSWGIDCGLNGVPGVYADVAFGRRWIDEQASKAGFNINEYQIV